MGARETLVAALVGLDLAKAPGTGGTVLNDHQVPLLAEVVPPGLTARTCQ